MADCRPELRHLANALSELDWADIQDVGVQLGMELHTFLQVERERLSIKERLLHSMNIWLNNDTVRPTWARVVTALRLSNKASLADRVERKYCCPLETLQTSGPLPSVESTPLSATMDPTTPSSFVSKAVSHTSSHHSTSIKRPKSLVKCNSPSTSTSSSPSSSPDCSAKPSPSSSPSSSPTHSPEMHNDHPITEASQLVDRPSLLRELDSSEQVAIKRVCSKAIRLEDKFVSVLENTKVLFSIREGKSDYFLLKLRHTLTSLPVSSQFKCLKYLRAERKAINNAKSTDDLFSILDDFWNWSDYYLLQKLITKFGDSKLQKDMTCYVAKLHRFEKATTIQEISKTAVGWKCPRRFKKVVLTLKDEASKITLYDIRRLREELSSKAPLKECVRFLLKSSHASEVVITLAFPPEALDLIPAALSENFLKKYCIKSIILDGMPLTAYTDEYVKVSTCKHKYQIYIAVELLWFGENFIHCGTYSHCRISLRVI